MTRGFHYRVLDAAGRRPDPRARARSQSSRWLTYAGALGEESTRRLLAGSLAEFGPLAATRFHGELEFRGPHGRQDSPDAALDAWPDMILFEIYSGRFAREARSGDDARMRRALQQATVEKMRELLARADDVLAGRLSRPVERWASSAG